MNYINRLEHANSLIKEKNPFNSSCIVKEFQLQTNIHMGSE